MIFTHISPTKILTAFFCLWIIGCSILSAQNDKQLAKQQTKEWKKKARMYVKNPNALKAKEEGYQIKIQELTTKNQELQQKNKQMAAELDKTDNSVKTAQATVDSYKNEVEKLRVAYEAKKKEAEMNVTPGLIYRVQIGAYKHFDMSKYKSKGDKSFEGESIDNMNKYTVGNFRDRNMADAFKSDLKKLGLKDAFVVAFQDGVRTNDVALDNKSKNTSSKKTANSTTTTKKKKK